MVAPQRIETARPRISQVRRAKAAAQKRKKLTRRSKHAALRRFSAGLLVALGVVMLYVMLTAHLTSVNYSIARAQRERAALQEESLRLDDRLAQLRSDERLAAVGTRLQMHDDVRFAEVRLPTQRPVLAGDRVALLSTISGWLRVK